MKIKTPLSILGTLLITLMGAYASINLFHFLAIKGLQAKTQATRDTVLVKLLNANLPDNPVTPNQSTQASQKPTNRETTTSGQSKSDSVFHSSRTIVRPIPPEISIGADQQQAAIQAMQLKNSSIPLWVILLGFVVLAACSIYVLYYNLPYFTDEMNKDLDPPKLTTLFTKFGGDFLKLGNPRKIKRLSNKLRFQYHYLELKGLANDDNLDKLCAILLFLENVPPYKSSDSPGRKIRNLADFESWLKWKNLVPSDTRTAQLIYTLNREILAEAVIKDAF